MKYGLPSVPWGHNIGDAVQSLLLLICMKSTE